MVGKLRYPEWADVTPATIVSGKVNLSETSKRVQDGNGRWISLACIIHVKGDILNGAEFKGGRVTVAGFTDRTIVDLKRPRNPDGTVNHTRIEVI